MTRLGVVINPIAGRRGSRVGEAERRRAFVRQAAAAHDLDVVIAMTERRGHGRELALRCVDAGCDVVAAMGGDGTVNEVAQALVGTTTPLAVLPCGSGDGFALGLSIPADWPRAFAVAANGRTRAIDVGYVNDRLFLNLTGFGFDAAVGQQFARRKTRGAWGYVSQSVQLVWRYDAPTYALEIEGHRRLGRWFLVGFANLPEYGNHAVLAPDADPADGLLDVVVAEAGSPWRQIWRARRLFWRHRAPAEGLTRLRAKEATLTGSQLLAHLDGEVWEVPGPAHVRIDPGALRVRVPSFRRVAGG